MMLAWSFAARTAPEVAALLRALGRHRYVRSVDHALHFTVDEALADDPRFAPHAAAFRARTAGSPALDPSSRDPALWREASVDDVAEALARLWSPGAEGERARARLRAALAALELPPAAHAPFASDPEDPPHPELVLLSWELWPIDELDADRHAGALAAITEAGDEVDVSAVVFQEGPCLAAPELLDGARDGALGEDFLVWSDGPYAYSDYVFRGAARGARLEVGPTGPRDL